MEISKELLSIILGEKAYDIKYVSDNIISFYTDYDQYEEINIYELAHKCKEWANKQGCKKVYSGIYESTDQGSLYICIISSLEANHTLDFWENTEQEAIFKASQYILDIQVN